VTPDALPQELVDLASLAHIAQHMPQLRVVSFNSTTIDSQRLRMFLFSAAQGAALSVHVWGHQSIWPEMLTELECLQIAAEVAISRGPDAPTLVWHPPGDKGGRYAANQLRVQ
jgi:hypothetical protein